MFKIGDAVVYGSSGVCMIDDIRNEYFLGEQALYYILTPVYSKGSTIFCPVNNDKLPIRAVRSKDELLSSLSSDTADTDEWIVNDQKRHEHFSAVLRTSDSGKLARMISLLWRNRDEMAAVGRKFRAADEKALADAEKILFGEMSYVLDISYDEAADMFRTAGST